MSSSSASRTYICMYADFKNFNGVMIYCHKARLHFIYFLIILILAADNNRFKDQTQKYNRWVNYKLAANLVVSSDKVKHEFEYGNE